MSNQHQLSNSDDEFDPYQFKQEATQDSSDAHSQTLPQQKLVQVKVDKNGYFRRDSDDSDPEDEDHQYKDSSDSEDDQVVKQLKNYYQQKTNNHSVKWQQQLLQENKKINLNYFDAQLEMQLNNKVSSALKASQGKIDDERIRNKDKNDRATVDQVLDPRTLIVIHKMVKNQKLDKVFGCLSTGKEANVYLAETSMDLDTLQLQDPSLPKKELAIKVFKTSILIFKDRERYVSGEFRFRKGHCKSNPRKMVQLWAEKEVRNLKRLNLTNGLIKAPKPYLLKNNVIVMEFIGENGLGAPRLKDANISDLQQTYIDILFILRRMYQMAKLVHADFSEYNLLYYKDEVYVIDVSQSVEHDHPMALEFLRRDCGNINDFFKRKGLQVLSMQNIFDFVTSILIQDENQYLTQQFQISQNQGDTHEQQVQEEVFKNIYIPRSLQEMSLEEIEQQKREKHETYYEKLTGLQDDNAQEEIKEVEDEQSGSDGEQEEGSEETNEDETKPKKQSVSLAGMTKEQKKEHKQKVKEEKREKRKTKMPKHLKKKLENKNKQ